jgi:NAD(P)-dependent dehydrogenase (short-subunit alcohol dehydrogenase family)
MDIRGKTVLVTGANRGLGKAIAQAFVTAGAVKVYAGARDPKSVTYEGVTPIALDVGNPQSIAAAAAQAGDVNILINNAGIFRQASLLDPASIAILRENLETNTFGVLATAQAFAPALGRNGGGAIVNVLSALAWVSIEGTGPYSASKSAAWAITNGLRRELAGQNTAVVGLHVGYMDTDMVAEVSAPKTAPAEVAQKILRALEAGEKELLIDETSRSIKKTLSSENAAYL